MIPPSSACVAAAIATHRRDRELKRLLDLLARSEVPLDGGIFVADNAAADSTRQVCEAAGNAVRWLPRERNDGPGGAWNTAIAAALQDGRVTHVFVLDDDVTPGPGILGQLLEAMAGRAAGCAAPLLEDDTGHLWGFPEPMDKRLRRIIRRAYTPQEAAEAIGRVPQNFCWATGACVLYERGALEEAGRFREDFWMLGEDLDLSMRVAARRGGVFTCEAVVPHLPPPPADPRTAAAANRLKFLALLQNLSYLAFHSPCSAHLRSYLAGNFKRYAATEGFAPGTLRDAWGAFWLGAVRGRPAGTPSGAKLRERARRRLGTP